MSEENNESTSSIILGKLYKNAEKSGEIDYIYALKENRHGCSNCGQQNRRRMALA
jgi:hypothetical protein